MIDGNGQSPFLHAYDGGHIGVVRLLTKAGADIHLTNTDNGSSALHFACGRSEDVDTIILLIEAGLNVNQTDNSNSTSLPRRASFPAK